MKEMKKLVTLKDGHTMYASAFQAKVDKIVNDLNYKLMPVDNKHVKTHGAYDLSIHVENFCPIKFRSVMGTHRYDSSLDKKENTTIVNINFY